MTPQELRASIIQQAIQGKLVEQRPEEGTGADLFQQIQAEKLAMVKAGTIKKGKAYPVISEEEIPFDIPDTWVMARLQDVVFNRGQEVPSETFCYIDIGSIDNKRQKLNAEDNVLEASKAPSRARKIVQLGDILYSTVRPYLHNMCIIDREFSHKPIASTGFAAMPCFEGIYNKYLFYYLLSPIFDSYANDTENAKGVAYPAINDDRLYRAVIAIPPTAEQKRIVAKLEEILPLIDRYEAAWNKLEAFNKRFPGDMQKSILQLAIQGKLVEQRPEEGTGEELFQQIQAEKQALSKAGKIKKEKPLPEIAEDEIPFDIPDSWKWVRLSAVIDVRDGTHDTPGYLPSGYPLITGKDFYYGYFDLSKTQYISKEDYIAISQRSKVDPYDILFSMIGGNIGSMIMITPENYFEMAIKNVALFKQYIFNDILPKYLFYFLKAQVEQMKSSAKGGAQMFVSLKMLRDYMFPLPPLAEQKRIVTKLEEILPLCDRLK